MAQHHVAAALGKLLAFFRTRIEKWVERRIKRIFVEIPEISSLLRRLNREDAVGVLSVLIDLLPDPDTKTPRGKLWDFGKDLLEIIPREVERFLNEEGGVGDFTGSGGGITGDGAATGGAALFLKMLSQELRSHRDNFLSWYSDPGRSPEEKKKFVLFVLSRDIPAIKSFLEMSWDDRTRFLATLSLPEVPPSHVSGGIDATVQTLSTVLEWMVRNTQASRQALAAGIGVIRNRLAARQYSRAHVLFLRIGGLKMDRRGRRIR